MVFTNDIISYVKQDNPVWHWVGSAPMKLAKDEIVRELLKKRQKCSNVVWLHNLSQPRASISSNTKAEWTCQSKLYILPYKSDILSSDLLELSLTHVVVGINLLGYGVEVALVESPDHTSNIDADVLDCLVGPRSKVYVYEDKT